MRPRTLPALLASGVLLAACTVGPAYRRPAIDTPAVYRGGSARTPAIATGAPGGRPATAPSAAATQSIGNEKWWDLFHDPVLQQLIRTALRQNYDVRIAATRVLQAQARLGITRANQFPLVAAGAQAFTERDPRISPEVPEYQANAGEVDLSVIWDLDFWGKYRRETEAARANLLASQWGRQAVLASVVSSVAGAYLQLRELDLTLQLSTNTLASRQMSLQLTNVLARNGSASMLDVRQSEQLVDTAAETIPDIQRQIAIQENALSTLLGDNPGAIPRGLALTAQPDPAQVPAGLPSELLERRPDIRQAEENLVAANAAIGVAKAAYFPDISLTGTAGFESNALNTLFTGPATLWNAVGALTQPVFAAGSLHSGVRLAESQQQELLLTYQQTIMEAFRQVSDSLISYQKYHEFRQQQELLTAAAADTDRLSKLLYQHGGVSYLQVLTSETNYFAAQLTLAQAQLNERLALVQLYDALGGGWQQ